MSFLRMDQQNLEGKRVLIREDLNVAINNGMISNDTRIRATMHYRNGASSRCRSNFDVAFR